MQNFSKSNTVITMWRPINSDTAAKLEDKNIKYIGKSIHTKAKSSEFGPIAGEIPVEQGLSKLRKAEDANDLVEKYNAKTQHLLEEDEKKLKSYTDININNYENINNQFLTTKITKKDKQGRIIYYLQKNGEIIADNDNRPIFVIQDKEEEEGKLLQYDYLSKNFSINFQGEQDNLKKYRLRY